MSTPSLALQHLRPLFYTRTLPHLDDQRRPESLPLAQIQATLSPALAAAKLDAGKAELVRALVLIWHDHLDESHTLSQEIHGGDASFLHGIMHRREPDYSNAKYWFHRVGQHGAFPEIARRTADLLRSAPALSQTLLDEGCWDAFAMIDATAAATRQKDSDTYRLLQQVQRVEMEVLLERFCD